MSSVKASGANAVEEQERPRQRSRRRQPEVVRARILKAALNAFATAGFEGASVRSIANDAHVSISLLIYHFKSKDELWRATIEDVVKKATPDVEHDPELLEAGSAAKRLELIIERSVKLFAEYPALHRLMTLEGHQPSERLIYMCDNYIQHNYKTVCALIAEAQAEGAVVDGDPSHLRMAITAMAAVPFSVSAEYQYLTRHNPFAKSEIDAIISLIKRLIFRKAA